MPLDMSPLYRKASQAAVRAAESEFARSPYGRLHRHVNRTLKQPARLKGVFSRMARRVTRPSAKQVVRQLIGVDPTHLVSEIRRYAKGDQLAATLVNEFLNAMGPAGSIIRALASGTTQQPDLEAMADVLRAQGYTVLPPEEAPGMARGGVPRAAKGRGAEEARREPVKIPKKGRPVRRPAKTVQLPMGDGRYKRFNRTHPIVTGEMVKASSSTNVHSFGYKLDSWTLFVRFWAGTHRNKHAGPLYSYHQVEPEKFLQMYRVRASGSRQLPGVKSPGTFVWERLRIAGTVSGHQYDYRLVGVARGYVPRKAVFTPEGEMYRARSFKTVAGKILRSQLPSELVDRGQPNRGRPNTGRS